MEKKKLYCTNILLKKSHNMTGLDNVTYYGKLQQYNLYLLKYRSEQKVLCY